MNKTSGSLLFISLFIQFTLFAKTPVIDTMNAGNMARFERFYVGTAMDAGILSTATIQEQRPNTDSRLGTPRFSYIINYGFTFNFNLSRHFGIYTGIDIKNIGFIEKENGGETVKRRTYNLGAPLAVKAGNLRHKGSQYLFLGGGLDVPVNYKEKEFYVRSQKTKFNEWFSERTPAVMPYVFVGAKTKIGITLKLQYYPNNFLNPDFVSTRGGLASLPYAGYDVHLILFSVGYDMHITRHKDAVKTSVANLRTNML